MSTRHPRVVLLTGAPSRDTLRWESGQLLQHLLPGFREASQRFLQSAPPVATLTSPVSAWRSIPLPQHQKDVSQSTKNASKGKQSQSTREQGLRTQSFFPALDGAHDDDFLEHSFALTEDLVPASAPQIADETTTTPFDSIDYDASTSFYALNDTDASLSVPTQEQNKLATPAVALLLSRLPLTDLRSLPSAAQLTRLYPQTVTPCMLAGIISAAPPRPVTIRPRRTGQTAREMDIIELLLGDETAAGFGVTFWLQPASNSKGRTNEKEESQERRRLVTEEGKLRDTLTSLRRGDVVLLTHIALSSFRGKVYGQSLRRRGFGGVGTGVVVVPDGVQAQLIGPQAKKLKNVREWTAQFVGPGARKRRRNEEDDGARGKWAKFGRLANEDLPDDTQ